MLSGSYRVHRILGCSQFEIDYRLLKSVILRSVKEQAISGPVRARFWREWAELAK